MALNHAKAIARTGTPAQLVAVADPSPSARDAMLAAVPGARGYESLDALLAESDAEVVHVCTPPATHAGLARRALEAGRHLYVEKPFVESTREAREILELAAARGLQVCAGHQLLFEAPTRRALELLPALGRLAHVESYFSFRTVRRTPGGRVPLRADLQLLDILPHPVYLLLELLERTGAGRTELAGVHVGERGTVHALVRRGDVTGTLVVTLEGRPVESYLRLVGTNGSLHADYVRGTVQRLIGPGTSGIDKVLAPYRLAAQLVGGTTTALSRRVLNRQTSYPGLAELFDAFYRSVVAGGPPALSPESILETTRIWEEVARALEAHRRAAPPPPAFAAGEPRVLVTGGTGFLGKALVGELVARGERVRVLARREPATWERVSGAEYVVADLGQPLDAALLRDVTGIIHAAAETAGGWDEHQRNSIDATEHLLRAAAAAGVPRVVHVSSLAVLARSGALSEQTPLEPDSRGSGPYVWGKLESERLATRLGKELGVGVKIARPGALVDYADFDPPGRLGKRLGNLFVGVGMPGDRLGTSDVHFSARALAWMLAHFDEAPEVINLLDPELPTKRQLIAALRRTNPDLSVVWLPMPVLVPLSWAAIVAQKLLRPGRPAINAAKVFAAQRYDTTRVAALARRMEEAPVPARA
jgi:predicted dehydrogenase/nucleoside-diphosphate-sugar epimerase